ncbi:hypothetical protein ACXIT0_06935 [Methylorubrum extorquens]
MRGAVVLWIAILSAASWHSSAEARGGRGSGSGGTPVRVSGYVNSRGTYVAPYYRTKADGILSNNLSYRGSASSYTYLGSVPVASADPLDVPTATVASLSQPTAPRLKMPWCSDGTIISGFCVLN